ncbi:MAG: hypothetical protein ETSY2_54295 [Candidatus Entotheonella gemina]|uniref:Uncharacterized protein n=1 Tax=Candidatus Entotheonella gemina TaxID=1429439 RepID=W4L254_9BACT|nr:MAG: hypothetical protein ETSY2_54295 [Candidatus Entotheonella gemina]
MIGQPPLPVMLGNHAFGRKRQPRIGAYKVEVLNRFSARGRGRNASADIRFPVFKNHVHQMPGVFISKDRRAITLRVKINQQGPLHT